MTVFNLNNVKLRTGEQFRETVDVQLEPLVLGGQEYVPVPDQVPSDADDHEGDVGERVHARLHA